MTTGARNLPPHHFTIRVPWHDNGWIGTFCNNPCANSSCTVLPRIALGRDDAFETKYSGKSIENLEQDKLPPCIEEHGTIMAPFPQPMCKQHPYAHSLPVSHGHFAPTPYTIQPFSVAATPFRWMLKKEVEGDSKKGIPSRADTLQLGYESDREPTLKFETGWIQEGQNQRTMLDTFFSAAKPNESLVFFYAKRTPLLEDPRRVIVGVGRVKSIGALTEYRYVNGNKPSDKMSGFLWERNIEHSIRPNNGDGFLLPYQDLLKLTESDDGIDLTECIAFAPDDFFENYSYGTELLPHDGAIASLLAIENAIKNMRDLVEAPWDDYLHWIDKELNRLWEVRGAFPGLGAALNAFGLPHGNLLAWYLTTNVDNAIDPWTKLSNLLDNPTTLPNYLQQGIGDTLKQKWKNLPDERRELLKLLARFNLSDSQAIRWYQETERNNAGIIISDSDILKNPYRIYEEDRLQAAPIGYDLIDRGMFPPEPLRSEFPIPDPSRVHEAVDVRRVRAVMIQTLEDAGSEGHTLLPTYWLINRIRARPMKPGCPIDKDILPIVQPYLNPHIETIELNDCEKGFQLGRYIETSQLISQIISKRKSGKLNEGDYDWLSLVNEAIDEDKTDVKLTEDDQKARYEKAAALETLYRSRVCVLMGAAGTGKSTLLKALCKIDKVQSGDILLLAPTGKARVRLEKASDMAGKGKTVAQFLFNLQRYDGSTGRYYINENGPRSSAHKTVIIDECSMLTEEQLAALLDAVKGIERLILVGDPKQLPPIGAGRPYVDIVNFLKPENYDSLFPIVAPCYTELTVTMRQKAVDGNDRVDVQLANAFSGRMLDAGADEVWHTVASGQTPFVKLVKWNQSDQLQKLLVDELANELKLKSDDDEIGFECSIGGVTSEYEGKTKVFFNAAYKGSPGTSEKVEKWQILSPMRVTLAGVDALNRMIQHRFRKNGIDLANRSYNKIIPAPAGPQGIIWGDKVINVINSGRRSVYPEKDDRYVANGDVGVVTGNYKRKSGKFFNQLEVELSSQPGYSYKYWPSEFDSQEGTPPLELAYALTIHKTQGSEFGTTFLIVPNPCRLLTREMLYTALTRHKGKVVILHQGDFKELQRYAHERASEIAKRLTNLFKPSTPVEVLFKNQSMFLDKNLIYLTERGELVRSKSEWIIADKLHAAGIDYQYEQALTLDGVERYPDFTIVDDDSGTTWYWEHNGMLSNDEYRKRWERKLAAYMAQGIKPYDGKDGNLLITEELEGVGLDASKIKKNIDAILGK